MIGMIVSYVVKHNVMLLLTMILVMEVMMMMMMTRHLEIIILGAQVVMTMMTMMMKFLRKPIGSAMVMLLATAIHFHLEEAPPLKMILGTIPIEILMYQIEFGDDAFVYTDECRSIRRALFLCKIPDLAHAKYFVNAGVTTFARLAEYDG